MKRFEQVEVVALPPAAVFRFLTDASRVPDWLPSVRSMRQVTPGPLAVGSMLREVRLMKGREATADFEVLALEPTRHYALGSNAGGVRSEVSFELAPDAGGGTRVVQRTTVRGRGPMALLEGLFIGMFRKEMASDLARLKAAVEVEAPATVAA